ncbi:GntR family transcriptional regulator [Nocardia cyriacigeorgica]|jgi:DNA-binding transcriptional regulator YhcF (GntR family)|uniref:GntR family transcriptional regulator n=1 Tax=Nocardia cyriacigeorgica TaxID=135487 RepID=UPI000CEA46EE|nr:GntR family transcriptional regulator [Nocardia cyriacigeorgica]AVH21226.1 GntR family transcriptional regulator [Nocardia cyriacigeorgica]MBF6499675.1 GntR family transcriptional regulator [Nocardia cyriacigeorgica]PPJ07649.1 GntR family transcriptional regulator [Nocardia cyriacigeorgica]
MDAIDPDDPRPPSQQIANVLRAAILTRKFSPGEKLPSGPQLVERYGVAKATVEQAIRILRDEGLVVSRKGSGVFVKERTERPVGLRPHIERAFESSVVTIDFAGFSGETLHGAIAEPLDRIREGRLRPESLTVRLLVPDASMPWSLPSRTDDLSDSPAFRRRATRIMERHAMAIVDSVDELARLGLVSVATAQVRSYPAVPLFKLYILNGEQAFFGYYPVREHKLELDGESVAIWDLMGKDASLFHFARETDPDTKDAQFVSQSQMWFDSIWNSVARDYRI